MKKNLNVNISKAMVPVNTAAPLPTTSSSNQDGKQHPPLAQAAVLHSTQIDSDYYVNNEKRLKAVLALLQAFIDQTYSPDARRIATRVAIGMLDGHMSKKEAEEVVLEVASKIRRNKSPIDSMF